MKLTILALALSAHAQTYFANPVGEDFPVRHDPSRKLRGSTEEDYDYTEADEYAYDYDYDYADADTAARAPIDGVDDVPAQIGTLLEGVLGPFLGTFQGLETPIVVRYASLIDALSWNCIATYHDSYLDALTKARPALATPFTHLHDTPHRLACILSAAHTFAHAFLPGAAPGVAAAAAARGLVLPETLDARVVSCGADLCADAAKQKARDVNGFDVNERCLVGAVADASYDPVIGGQAVAQLVMKHAAKDGWNALGHVGTDGKPCTANCRPFRDTTSYEPKTRFGRAYYREHGLDKKTLTLAERPVPWRPLSEDDGRGFFVLHQHVTPHIGTTGKTRVLSEAAKDARVAPSPKYNYAVEAELVLDRLKVLDDRKKMQVEWFDDKLNLILTMFGTLVGSGAFQSFESAVAFLVGYTAAEYDALLVVWKEKVRHDLVRPTTVIQGTRPERMVRTWGGPHRSSQKLIKRKDVEPYKRVMPHSEYPSGSSCLCQVIADYANAFLAATGVTMPPLQYVAPAGSSKVEPGTTPAQDVTLTYATVDALAAACGASRLDGGMHFTGAVQAGEELCKGIGTAGFEYASDLIGGEW